MPEFRRGDPVAYTAWRFDERAGFVPIEREARIALVAGDRFYIGFRYRQRVPAGHLMIVSDDVVHRLVRAGEVTPR